jgi:hypothetical protein
MSNRKTSTPKATDPTPEQIRKARDEAHERHLAFYFDPDPVSDCEPARVVEYRFEVAITNLLAMLEANQYIGVDWGHDEAGEATLERRPHPGSPLPNEPSVELATDNYRDAVITHRDCEELAGKLPQTPDVRCVRAILARMAWHLDGSGRQWAAEDLAKQGRTEEAVGVLREALRLSHDECAPAMKDVLSRIDTDDVGLVAAQPEPNGSSMTEMQSGPAAEGPVLVETDWQILRYLAESESPMIQSEIAQGTSKGDGTIKTSVQTLERHAYIDRPCGPRKGYRITRSGKDRLIKGK